AGFHGRSMKSDLKSVNRKVMDKFQIRLSLQRIRRGKNSTALRAIERPDGFRCPEPMGLQSVIDRFDILQRGVVRIVENRESKLLAVWKLHRQTGSQEADLAQIELTKKAIED